MSNTNIGQIILSTLNSIPDDTHEEYLSKLEDYKAIIDKTPNKFLQYHLNDCIEKEQYELAQYIKDKAKIKGFELKNKQ